MFSYERARINKNNSTKYFLLILLSIPVFNQTKENVRNAKWFKILLFFMYTDLELGTAIKY